MKTTTGLATALVFFSCGVAQAQLACSDKSTPRECYEAGLDFVGKTLATLEAKERELDNKLASVTVPTGAVMAFDSKTGCPAGWKDYTDAMGRVIVGADPLNWPPAKERNRDDNNRQLTTKGFEKTGGSEGFTLTKDDVPAQDVTINSSASPLFVYQDYASRNDDNAHSLVAVSPNSPASPFSMKTTGKGSEHKYMPPYISLYYCIKG